MNGLDLSSSKSTLTGGESEPAIVPGKLADSSLWQRFDKDEMSPKERLSPVEKEVLTTWTADEAAPGH